MSPAPACRSCGAALATVFADLGETPLANSFVRPEDLNRRERFYPLRAYACDACHLVQLEAFESPAEIFGDYAYFSSYSESWLAHARAYAGMIVERIGLAPGAQVVEVASNDGYLLRNFLGRGFRVLGIDPAANVARAAEAAGVPTRVAFFGETLARDLVAEGITADLLIGNNVLAHVPELNDFVAGLGALLAPRGVLTMEFPHLLRLIEENQFDTIYHEHFSYFSLLAAQALFARHGLRIFDVELLPTHGGSLRIHVAHESDRARPEAPAVAALIGAERAAGLDTPAPYYAFAGRVEGCRRELLRFLHEARDRGRTVAGYGAPAKGNTLLNYCGVGPDLVAFTVDKSPHKQGTYLPGTHIPVYAPERLRESRPDYVLILPWNLKEEVMAQTGYVREWGGRFVVPIPSVAVVP
ncbi:MAG TPA: class I SAM-dependent methyltransferase [Candidatus Eisenbacteria bacterium]|jgi:2-polyprenyl-3-methyl-5-hydroxy-6-metoxy-1,4-benzoquinol methylase